MSNQACWKFVCKNFDDDILLQVISNASNLDDIWTQKIYILPESCPYHSSLLLKCGLSEFPICALSLDMGHNSQERSFLA